MNLHAFIADLHLGHANVLIHDGRPWPDIAAHNEALTANCSQPGNQNRILWLLGDVGRHKVHVTTFVERIRPFWGRIHLIRGNHDDRAAWACREIFDEAHEAKYLRVSKEIRVYMSHYACRTWRGSNRGSFHLHGHSHGALAPVGRSMDVGANCIGYRPILLEEVIRRLNCLPLIDHHKKDPE